MFVYSVRVSAEKKIKDDWLRWMKEKHIPDVMSTNCFQSYEIYEVMNEDNSSGNTEFIINYFYEEEDSFERYQKEFAPALQKEHTELFKGKFTASREILKRV